MSAAVARRRGPGLVATLAVLMALVALVALGVWQLQRRTWKTALLGRVAALQTAPAETLQAVADRLAARGPDAADFVRVSVVCDGLGAHNLHLYGLRAAGPGWRQITACRLPAPLPETGYRSVLVDLGFEAEPEMARPKVEPVGLAPTAAQITGVLRTPERAPWFAAALGLSHPAAQSGDGGQWMRRDVAAMARALGAPAPAPFMLTLESPAAGPRLIAQPLPTDIPNRHFEYALTWFGLAFALAGLYAASVARAFQRS